MCTLEWSWIVAWRHFGRFLDYEGAFIDLEEFVLRFEEFVAQNCGQVQLFYDLIFVVLGLSGQWSKDDTTFTLIENTVFVLILAPKAKTAGFDRWETS